MLLRKEEGSGCKEEIPDREREIGENRELGKDGGEGETEIETRIGREMERGNQERV